jgi:flagellar biosynthesis protein FlhA
MAGESTSSGFFKGLSWEQMGLMGQVIRSGEIIFSVALITILVILILPVPKILLDFFLAISLAFSVIVLMTVLFLERPLQLSAFPTILLVATMLRLSLNVASTRLILSHGHEGTAAAGQVIKAFGSFIMSGNFFIGLIVFSILVIINFVVITKGSGRIAEVVARFSLDSLPGKQMAVDADLSSGLIDQEEAKKRRRFIQEETNFYGAMDGAAKFVRGDAIAGLLITFINLVGGILIGVVQQGVSFSQAAQTYSVLTVGDGLVTQIPALIISVGAGMLISKASSEGTTNQAFSTQFGAYPIALGMSSFLMGLLGFLPGIPTIPFFLLAGATGFSAWKLSSKKQQSTAADQMPEVASQEPSFEQALNEVLKIEPVKLELGLGLVSLVKDPAILINRIKAARQDLASELGILIPSVRIVDNLSLGTNSYCIKIKEIEANSGKIFPQKLLALNPTGEPVAMEGEVGKEPIFGVEGKWIYNSERAIAENRGYLVTEGPILLTAHLVETIKDYLSELLSFSVVQQLVETLSKPTQRLYNEMVPTQLAPAHFQRILQNLLSERISIRDFSTIVEAIGEGVQITRSAMVLTEMVRSRIGRQICSSALNKEGVLQFLGLSDRWEHEFQNNLTGEGDQQHLTLPPSRIQEFVTRIQEVFDTPNMRLQNPLPVLLTTPSIRPHVRSIIERVRPQIMVLSQNELYSKVSLKSLGEI